MRLEDVETRLELDEELTAKRLKVLEDDLVIAL
jgi:hypothetical protein